MVKVIVILSFIFLCLYILNYVLRRIYRNISETRRVEVISYGILSKIQIRYLISSGETIYVENPKNDMYVLVTYDGKSVTLHDLFSREDVVYEDENFIENFLVELDETDIKCYNRKVLDTLYEEGFRLVKDA